MTQMLAYEIINEATESQPYQFSLTTSTFRGQKFTGLGSCTSTDERTIFNVSFYLKVEGDSHLVNTRVRILALEKGCPDFLLGMDSPSLVFKLVDRKLTYQPLQLSCMQTA